MIIVGLTGSIGMGKSTTARMFADAGTPVYDADAEVGRLYAAGGAAVEAVGTAFPGVVREGAIDKNLLGQHVLGDPEALGRLNALVWPLMGAARAAFFERAKALSAPLVVLDIPLLFETGGERNVDVTVVATAPPAIQRQRVLARPGMTEEKLAAVLKAQTPDAEKRRRADFIVDTSRGMEEARAQVRQIIDALRLRPNRVK